MNYIYSNEKVKKGDLILWIFKCDVPNGKHTEWVYDVGATMLPCIVTDDNYVDEERGKTLLITPYKLDNGKWKEFVFGKNEKNGKYVNCIQMIDEGEGKPSYRLIKYDWLTHSDAKITKEKFMAADEK